MGKICVAIDGGAATGKSSVAKSVAAALKYEYLNTGWLYRAVAYAASALSEKEHKNEAKIADLLARFSLRVAMRRGAQAQLYLNDKELLPEALEEPRVAQLSSLLASQAQVRAYLLPIQQKISKKKGVILDGRDIGTVVVPDAALKVFLFAPVAVRVERRLAQYAGNSESIDRKEVEKALLKRDAQDTQRAICPLKPAPDARHINTALKTQAEQVDQIVTWVQHLEQHFP